MFLGLVISKDEIVFLVTTSFVLESTFSTIIRTPSQGERSDGEKPAVAGDFQQSAASAENL